MDSENYLSWCSVKNTVKNRLQENLLINTFTKKKIRKVTKLINIRTKNCNDIKTYSQFLQCKNNILKILDKNVDVTDESDFSNDDYESFYNNFEISNTKDFEINTKDWFLWHYIEKQDCNKIEPKSKDNKQKIFKSNASSIQNNSDKNDKQCEHEINYSSEILSNYVHDVVDGTNALNKIKKGKITQNKNFSKEKNSLSPKKIINKKHLKYLKKNLTSSLNKFDLKISELSDDEWIDEFIPSDFEKHNKKIFSSTFSDINQKNVKISNNKCSLSQIEMINQPRDSGIEEDSREDNAKQQNVSNTRCTNKSAEDIKGSEYDKVYINKNEKKYSNIENTIQRNGLKNIKDRKPLNNLKKTQENKNTINAQNKKLQLKIIGEEKVRKKYKIINNTELSQQVQHLKPKFDKVNNVIYEETECNNENNEDHFDSLTNIKKSKRSKNKYCSLSDNSDRADVLNKMSFQYKLNSSVNVNDKSDNKEKHKHELKNKLKNSKSLYLTHECTELKHFKLLENNENDSDYEPDLTEFKNNREKLMQFPYQDEDKYNFLSNEHLSDNSNENTDENTIKKSEEQHLASSNRKIKVQTLVDTDSFSGDENLNNNDLNAKGNTKMRLSKNENIDVNPDEKNYNNETKKIKEKNTILTNVNIHHHGDTNNINIISDCKSSQILEENKINKVNNKIKNIDILNSCDLLYKKEIDYDNNKVFGNCKKLDTINFITDEKKNTFLIDTDKNFEQTNELDFVRENKIDNENDETNKENKESVRTKKHLGLLINDKSSIDDKSSTCSDSNAINSDYFYIDNEKNNTVILDCVIKDKNINNSISNDNNIHKNTRQTLKHCISGNKKSNNEKLLNIDTLIYNSDNEIYNKSDKESINRNFEMNKKDQEADTASIPPISFNPSQMSDTESVEEHLIHAKQTIENIIEIKQLQNYREKILKSSNDKNNDDQIQKIDINSLSPDVNKKSKLLKNVSLHKKREDISDGENLIKSTNHKNIENKKLQNNFEKNLKSSDSQNDDQIQDMFVNTLSPDINKRSKLLKNLNLCERKEEKFDEESLIICLEKVNKKNSTESDYDEEGDSTMSSTLQKISQFKKMDLFNATSSSSEDEQSIVINKNLTNNLITKDKILGKKNNLNIEKTDSIKLDVSSVNNKYKINRPFTDKLVDTELLAGNNKIVKSTSVDEYIMEDLKLNHKESNDEEDDVGISNISLQKLSQFKKMDLFNASSSSSGDEQSIVINKNLTDNLKQRDKILEKQNNLNIENAGSIKFDVSNVDSKCKISGSFINKLSDTELLTENNKIVELTSVDEYNLEDLNLTHAEINDVKESKQLNENLKKKTIINETQESVDVQKEVLESQEIFSSLDNLTETLNLDQLISNEDSVLDSTNVETINQIPSTPQVNKITKISEIVKKEKLSKCLIESTIAFSKISNDEEVFLLDVSKEVFNKNLIGEKISFSKKALELGNSKYEAFQKRFSPSITCVFNFGKDSKNLYKILNIRPVLSMVTRRKKNLIDLNQNADFERQNDNKGIEISLRSVENQCTNNESDNKSLLNIYKNKTKITKEIESRNLKSPNKRKLSNSSLKIEKEDKISNRTISTEEKRELKNRKMKNNQTLKRKLTTFSDDCETKNEILDCESTIHFSNKSSSPIKGLKSCTINKKNKNRYEDANDEKIQNKLKLKNTTLECNELKSNRKQEYKIKKLKSFTKEVEGNISHKKSNQVLFSSKNKNNSMIKYSKNEITPSTKKRKVESESDRDSNSDLKIEKKPKLEHDIKKELNFKIKNKHLKKKKIKTKEKRFKSAMEEVINLIRNNIKFNSENYKYGALDKKHCLNKKNKFCMLSSSDEDDYANRSFQIMDKTKLKNNKNANKSLSHKKSSSGVFIVKDNKDVTKKIYFDE